MFSTLLKSITSYFNTHALVSSFFPSLLFWVLTLGTVQLGRKGWNWAAVMQGWNGLKYNEETLLVAAFFLWVLFWAFLTLNFHSTLLRLYEGYWPLASLSALRRRHWQARWNALDARDKELEAQEGWLEGEREAYNTLRDSAASAPPDTPAMAVKITWTMLRHLVRLEKEVDRLERQFSGEESTGSSRRSLLNRNSKPWESHVSWELIPDGPNCDLLKKLEKLGSEVRDSWQFYSTCRNPVPTTRKDLAARCCLKSEELIGRLARLVEGQWSEVEERRLRLNHEFFLTYPPHRDETMPTLLGNVLAAAEARIRLRYNLDALLIWSRLQPLLSKEVAEAIQGAKSSLDLMLTVSFSVLLFGLPLSVWSAFHSTTGFHWWVPLLALVLALVARLRVAAVPAVAALALKLFLFLPLSLTGGVPEVFRVSEVILTSFAVLLLLSWVCYQNAVQACLVYGEKLQATFDLHRWEVLEKMHLQLPPDYPEERGVWGQLGQMLYRGYEPSSDYYRYVKAEKKTKEPVPAGRIRLPVPIRPLPAYRPIADDEIVEVEVSGTLAPADAVPIKSELVGMIPITTLPAAQPVRTSVLRTVGQLEDYVAVGIEVSTAQSLGGKLEPGDLLEIIIVMSKTNGDSSPAPVKRHNVLVLDVAPGAPAGGLDPGPPQSIVIIALPRAEVADFMAQKGNGTLIISRRICTRPQA